MSEKFTFVVFNGALKGGSMITTLYNARVITPEHIFEGGIVIEDDRILRAFRGAPAEMQGEFKDCGGAYLMPGFVDIHVHGAYEAMFDADPETLNRATRYHALHGTTSILPTTASARPETVLATVKNIAEAVKNGNDGARVLGAHLEGCYFNPKCAGAQNPDFLFPAAPENYMPMVETGVVRRHT